MRTWSSVGQSSPDKEALSDVSTKIPRARDVTIDAPATMVVPEPLVEFPVIPNWCRGETERRVRPGC